MDQSTNVDKSTPVTIDTIPPKYDTASKALFAPPVPPPYQTNNGDFVVVLSKDFTKSLAGIIKVVQMVFSLVAFILATVTGIHYDRGIIWVQIVTMTTFILTGVLYAMHAFKIQLKFNGKVSFKFIELCYYALITLCYLSCGIVCSVYSGKLLHYYDISQGQIMAVAAYSCFLCMFLYGVDIYFRYIVWRRNGEGPYLTFMKPSYSPASSGSSAAARAAATTQY